MDADGDFLDADFAGDLAPQGRVNNTGWVNFSCMWGSTTEWPSRHKPPSPAATGGRELFSPFQA